MTSENSGVHDVFLAVALGYEDPAAGVQIRTLERCPAAALSADIGSVNHGVLPLRARGTSDKIVARPVGRPSFLMDLSQNLFYCYSCVRGDVIRFAELYH